MPKLTTIDQVWAKFWRMSLERMLDRAGWQGPRMAGPTKPNWNRAEARARGKRAKLARRRNRVAR